MPTLEEILPFEPLQTLLNDLDIKNLTQFSLVNKYCYEYLKQFWQKKVQTYFEKEYRNIIVLKNDPKEIDWQEEFKELWNRHYSGTSSEYQQFIMSIYGNNLEKLAKVKQSSFFCELAHVRYLIKHNYQPILDHLYKKISGIQNESDRSSILCSILPKEIQDDLGSFFSVLTSTAANSESFLLVLKVVFQQNIKQTGIAWKDPMTIDSIIKTAAAFGNLRALELFEPQLTFSVNDIKNCLKIACLYGCLEVAQFFIDKLIQMTTTEELSKEKFKEIMVDLLWNLGRGENTNMTRFLINKSIDYGCMLFHRACQTGNMEMVDLLLDYGVDWRTKGALYIKDNHSLDDFIGEAYLADWTILHSAVYGGNIEIISKLRKLGTHHSANKDLSYTHTPLHLAVLVDQTGDLVEFLLAEEGIEIDNDVVGVTPLQLHLYQILPPVYRVVGLLVKAGASCIRCDDDGHSILDLFLDSYKDAVPVCCPESSDFKEAFDTLKCIITRIKQEDEYDHRGSIGKALEYAIDHIDQLAGVVSLLLNEFKEINADAVSRSIEKLVALEKDVFDYSSDVQEVYFLALTELNKRVNENNSMRISDLDSEEKGLKRNHAGLFLDIANSNKKLKQDPDLPSPTGS